MADHEERIKELTEENKKLRNEVVMLVNEAARLRDRRDMYRDQAAERLQDRRKLEAQASTWRKAKDPIVKSGLDVYLDGHISLEKALAEVVIHLSNRASLREIELLKLKQRKVPSSR